MTVRVTIEVAQRGTRSVSVRGVRTVVGRPELSDHTPTHSVSVEDHGGLDASSLYELVNAVEQEIKGWAAKLPLDYA